MWPACLALPFSCCAVLTHAAEEETYDPAGPAVAEAATDSEEMLPDGGCMGWGVGAGTGAWAGGRGQGWERGCMHWLRGLVRSL